MSLIRSFKWLVRQDRTTCRVATTYDRAKQLLVNDTYDAVILSADLSEDNGLSVVKMLKNEGRKEIIVITAESQTTSTAAEKGFTFDDYLNKPYEAQELYSRIKVILRKKIFGIHDHPVQFGNLVIDPENWLVFIAQQPIPLTRKEILILFFLLKNRNRVVSTKAIFEELFNRDAKYQHGFGAVYEYIKNLKKKLSSFAYPDYIINIKGVGYRFDWDDKN